MYFYDVPLQKKLWKRHSPAGGCHGKYIPLFCDRMVPLPSELGYYQKSMMSRMTPFLIRNCLYTSSRILWTGCSWHTLIHARELNIGTHLKNPIYWWSMKSRNIPSSKYSVSSHKCLSSMTSRTGCSWQNHMCVLELKIDAQVYNHI